MSTKIADIVSIAHILMRRDYDLDPTADLRPEPCLDDAIKFLGPSPDDPEAERAAALDALKRRICGVL